MVANPAHEIYRASAGAVGCATHRFVKSPDDLDAFGADVSGDSSGDIRVIRTANVIPFSDVDLGRPGR